MAAQGAPQPPCWEHGARSFRLRKGPGQKLRQRRHATARPASPSVAAVPGRRLLKRPTSSSGALVFGVNCESCSLAMGPVRPHNCAKWGWCKTTGSSGDCGKYKILSKRHEVSCCSHSIGPSVPDLSGFSRHKSRFLWEVLTFKILAINSFSCFSARGPNKTYQ